MNKEEIEAIADLKEQIKQDKEELPYSKESLQYKQTLLDLIDKLQKFIENGEFTWKQKYEETFNYVKENFISKDIVRKFIKKYTKESLKDFSPYIINEGTAEQERKAGQLRILEKMRKELLGE